MGSPRVWLHLEEISFFLYIFVLSFFFGGYQKTTNKKTTHHASFSFMSHLSQESRWRLKSDRNGRLQVWGSPRVWLHLEEISFFFLYIFVLSFFLADIKRPRTKQLIISHHISSYFIMSDLCFTIRWKSQSDTQGRF